MKWRNHALARGALRRPAPGGRRFTSCACRAAAARGVDNEMPRALNRQLDPVDGRRLDEAVVPPFPCEPEMRFPDSGCGIGAVSFACFQRIVEYPAGRGGRAQ